MANKNREMILIDPFPHFRMRLKERYDIDCDYNQYLDLCALPVKILIQQEKNRQVVRFEYEQQLILAVRYASNSRKLLITALPPNSRQISQKRFKDLDCKALKPSPPHS